MRQRVSSYIADFLVDCGITDVFTVVGGGAMYLNDALGHHPGLHCTYQHHEQACAMAAEAYARIDNRIAAVCVTTGPGATNAITGCLGGWMDSIPMLILSGQARYATTVESSGLPLRSRGIQECNIVPVVTPITKYAVMITDPRKIRYHLQKAVHEALSGRPGPVWLDIPLDVQSAFVETEELESFPLPKAPRQAPDAAVAALILDRIRDTERPVIYPGNGVRLAGAYDDFIQLVEILGVPVVTGMSSVDGIWYEHPLFAGLFGSTGHRAGNFAVQNSSLFLSIGARLGYNQTGFNYQTWARDAFTILCDIDENELKKDSLHVDMGITADAGSFIRLLYQEAKKRGASKEQPLFPGDAWRAQCAKWKRRYPVVSERHYQTLQPGRTNIYAFYHELSRLLPEDMTLQVSAGTSRVCGSQAFRVKKGQRFITNSNTAAMGFDLPAAIGVCIAEGRRPVAAVTGEGSLQMNIQELQTIRQNDLPIKLFVINNEGYHSIRQTQNNYFGKPLIGIGPESGDLSFPDLSKLIPAYGFPYEECHMASELPEVIRRALETDGPAVVQIFVTSLQNTEPKTSSRKLEDGTMVTAPLEDMSPFLDREELKNNMYIPLVKESLKQ